MHEPIVLDGVEHAPGEKDAGGHERCVGCGYRWPCPDVRRQPEPLLDGGELVLDLVDVGWSIFRRLPPGADYVPPGGIVCEVEWLDDPNAGGRYRVLQWRAGRPDFEWFGPRDFDPLLSNPPNSASIRSNARKLAALVGQCKGTATPAEYEWLRLATALLAVVA